jgi:hypothetical protein
LARVPTGPTLAKKVPTLIEGDLECSKPIELPTVETPIRVRKFEPMLLLGELGNPLNKLGIIHVQVPSHCNFVVRAGR